MSDDEVTNDADRATALTLEERVAQLDPIRRLILRRSRERRLTLADLSRVAEKNAAYFHQFMWTNRPRRLPEEVREVIAPLLGLPEDMLRPDRPHAAGPRLPFVLHNPVAGEVTKFDRPAAGGPPSIPVYRDTDVIAPEAALDWLARPIGLVPPGPLFALWISRPGGRMQVGDLALITEGPPPRPGDSVIALQEQRVAALGTLKGLSAARAVIVTGQGEEVDVELASARVLKVVALMLG